MAKRKRSTATKVGRPGRRGPGRPAGQPGRDVRGALLAAAREALVDVGFDGASLRSIAARAGVNPAMISYYFGGKESLARAVLRDAVAPLLERLGGAGDAGVPPGPGDVLGAYAATLAANPWLPQLIVREVLPENGRLREPFIEELASRASVLLPGIVTAAQRSGAVRAELDPRLVTVSLVSLAAFPYLAAPVLERVLGIDVADPAAADRLTRHALDVLERGVGAGAGG